VSFTLLSRGGEGEDGGVFVESGPGWRSRGGGIDSGTTLEFLGWTAILLNLKSRTKGYASEAIDADSLFRG